MVGNEANKGHLIVITGSGEYQSPTFGLQNITLLLLGDASLLAVTVSNPITRVRGFGLNRQVRL